MARGRLANFAKSFAVLRCSECWANSGLPPREPGRQLETEM